MVEMSDIVSKLVERTEQDMIPWKATADENAFVATFGNLSVMLSIPYSGDLKLSVLDERGREIDYTVDPFNALFDLHRSIKRKALGTEQKLAELMEALDKTSL